MIVTLVVRSQTITLTIGALNTSGGVGGGGVSIHNDLTGRSTTDAHPIAAITGLQAALDAKAASGHTHSGVYEPANANLQAHVGSTSNPHSTTAAQVGADASGTAAAAVAAHAIAADPHGDRAFSIQRANHTGTQLAATISDFNATVDARLAAVDAMAFKGVLDASTNPNYPAGDAGNTYVISVDGKIGGASGPNVKAGDMALCLVDATSSGNHATVGANWALLEMNLDGAVIGPTSTTNDYFTVFDGTSGKLVKAFSGAQVRTALGLVVGTDVQAYSAVLAGTTASFTSAQEAKLAGIEALADVTDAGNVGAAIDGAAAKTTPVDADTVALIDSAAASALKKLSWANIKATAKTYFDTLYQAILVSGTNIKTVNSTSLLGSGDIAITGLTAFTAAESTSGPNATVPVASLTANNAATNVDAALRPKGIGSVLANVPDSATAGGNKRGTNSVDLQTIRGSAAQVASGAMSVICGGTNNIASNTAATVSGGGFNTASGSYSTVSGGQSNSASGFMAAIGGGQSNSASGSNSWTPGGLYGTDRAILGSGFYSTSRRTANGDRQTMLLPIACAARTDATATVMTSDAGSASAANQMVLPNNSAYMCTVEVVAFDPGGILAGAWEYKFLIKRGANAASTAIVGTPTLIWSQNGLSGGTPGIAITADTANGCPAVTFTGIAATTLYPSGHITARQCA